MEYLMALEFAFSNLKVFALDDEVAVLIPLHHRLRSSCDAALKEDIVLLVGDMANGGLCQGWGDKNGKLQSGVEAVLAVLCPALVSTLVLKLHVADGEAAVASADKPRVKQAGVELPAVSQPGHTGLRHPICCAFQGDLLPKQHGLAGGSHKERRWLWCCGFWQGFQLQSCPRGGDSSHPALVGGSIPNVDAGDLKSP